MQSSYFVWFAAWPPSEILESVNVTIVPINAPFGVHSTEAIIRRRLSLDSYRAASSANGGPHSRVSNEYRLGPLAFGHSHIMS